MKNRLLGLILLASIAIVYVVQPYYGGVSAQVHDVARYALAICGTWVSIKLLIRN